MRVEYDMVLLYADDGCWITVSSSQQQPFTEWVNTCKVSSI